MSAPNALPRWADLVLLPAVCLLVALMAAAGVVALVGQDPVEVITVLIHGAFGTPRGLSYTLYYATTFIFTGLAVAVAFHGGLFNIGGEGQAILGGLGDGLGRALVFRLSARLDHAAVDVGVGGAVWHGVGGSACLPASLPGQPCGDYHHHVQLHCQQFAGLPLGQSFAPTGRDVGRERAVLRVRQVAQHAPCLGMVGCGVAGVTAQYQLVSGALLAALGVYLFLWRTRAGYHLRSVGSSPSAAEYAGVQSKHQIVIGMAISGALAGMVGMNEIAGVNGKLLLEFVSGAGFTGIAVALMGRNHPLGIIFASVLFGALFQGGAEVAFEVRGFSRDMVVMLQGFIVLFSGAMVYVIAPWVSRALGLVTGLVPQPKSVAQSGDHHG